MTITTRRHRATLAATLAAASLAITATSGADDTPGHELLGNGWTQLGVDRFVHCTETGNHVVCRLKTSAGDHPETFQAWWPEPCQPTSLTDGKLTFGDPSTGTSCRIQPAPVGGSGAFEHWEPEHSPMVAAGQVNRVSWAAWGNTPGEAVVTFR